MISFKELEADLTRLRDLVTTLERTVEDLNQMVTHLVARNYELSALTLILLESESLDDFQKKWQILKNQRAIDLSNITADDIINGMEGVNTSDVIQSSTVVNPKDKN